MLKVTLRPVLPGKEERLRNWLTELQSRADEVRATFRDESVRAEQAFIVDAPAGPALLYVSEAADLDTASSAYRSSDHPIDHEHRAIIRECTGEKYPLSALYSLTL